VGGDRKRDTFVSPPERSERAQGDTDSGTAPATHGPALQHAIDRIRGRWGVRGLTRGTAVVRSQ
jgi:hypothetical protein